MNEKIQKVKTKLLELGYIDNEWLDKYLEMVEINLYTPRDRKSTQEHHAIPVNSYWTSDEPYNRKEALKLSRLDNDNFKVNLLYKDHLLAHSYLTLCTDLFKVQRRYVAQAELRRHNSAKASANKKELIMPMPKAITEEKILSKLAMYDAAREKAIEASDDKAVHKYRTMVAQWKSKYRQYLANADKYTPVAKADQPRVINKTYHETAQKKRELKQAINIAHEKYNTACSTFSKGSLEIDNARRNWKQAINKYNHFCLEHSKVKI